MRGTLLALAVAAAAAGLAAKCGGDGAVGSPSPDGGAAPAPRFDGGAATGPAAIPYVFVVAMENQDADRVYGDAEDFPYINGALIPRYARATAYADVLPHLPSEPHYVWMEAGTNTFADHTFTTDDRPSSSNSTASRDHLVTQIAAAGGGVDWMSYQEGISDETGRCPIEGAGFYRPRHNPFVFFQDVVGAPPSKDSAACIAHHRDFSALASDLARGAVARYNFITPNLCHDMHGDSHCPAGTNRRRAGDDWLAANLPPLIQFVEAQGGVIFLLWEEGDATATLPFLAIGPGVKPGYAGAVPYTHGSLLKTIEQILDLPILPAVATENDLSDLFQ